MDILDILTGITGEEADARAMPLPDGPMRSLATLGVPLLAFGNAEGSIPLSRITDVTWPDAAAAAPLIPSNMDGGIPLSRLTDVLRRDAGGMVPPIDTGEAEVGVPAPTDAMWRDQNFLAPSEQGGIGASGNAENAWAHADAMPLTPSPDPSSHYFATSAELGEDAYAPVDAQTAASVNTPQQSESGRWGGNVPRIVVTPQRYEPSAMSEYRADTSPYRSDWPVYRPAATQADQNFGYDDTGRPIGAADPPYDGADALSDLLDLQSDQIDAANGEQPFEHTGQLIDTDSWSSHNRAVQPAWNGVQLAGFKSKPPNPLGILTFKPIPGADRGSGGAARAPQQPSNVAKPTPQAARVGSRAGAGSAEGGRILFRPGRYGGPEHRAKVSERGTQLEAQGCKTIAGGGKRKEIAVFTRDGRARFPDIICEYADGRWHYENIGRQNRFGRPVPREERALRDIWEATGQNPVFTPYNWVRRGAAR